MDDFVTFIYVAFGPNVANVHWSVKEIFVMQMQMENIRRRQNVKFYNTYVLYDTRRSFVPGYDLFSYAWLRQV